MNLFTQSIYSGLMSGAVYALLAVGLVIAFRTSRVLNLAHGETYVIGGLTTAMVADATGSLWIAVPAGLLTATLFSVAVERVFLRPRSDWPVSSLILVTLALAFLVRGVMLVIAGIDPLSYARLIGGPPIRFAGGAMPWQGVALIGVGLLATVLLALFLARTRLGRQLRASAENPDAAQLMGIDVGATRLKAFGIAGFLGGLAAVLLVPLVPVDFQAGLGMTLRGFIAAALAGMSAPLAIACGFGLGLFEAFVTSYIGALAQDPIVFLILIGIALWQSRGIRFGGGARA
ncbi:MAG: branched-chain amino acid ABC transporter permease [Burkholderiales bacterium]